MKKLILTFIFITFIFTIFTNANLKRKRYRHISEHKQKKLLTYSSLINPFTLNLFKKLLDSKDNVFISGYSISTAFAICYNGANGKTKEEMKNVLNFPNDFDILNKKFLKLSQIQKTNNNGYTLEIANALWGQKNFPFKESYINKINTYYNGGFKTVDFSKTKEAVNTINNWVKEKTHDKITKLLKEKDIDSLTRLIITNAIYFKGKWKKEFKSENTYKADFYIDKNTKKQVDMMHKEETLPYFEDDKLKAIKMPYKGRNIYMLILLPKDGFSINDIKEKLTTKNFNKYLHFNHKYKVKISFPKFEIKDKYYLSNILKSMGMNLAFSLSADFSNMTGDKSLYIGKVIHKTYIKVNETGTESAAVTGIEMRLKSMPPLKEEIKIFNVNKPFIFFIIDKRVKTILFSGKIKNI